MTRLFNALLVKRPGEALKEPFTAELAGNFNPGEQFLESWRDLDARLRPTGRILLGYRRHGLTRIYLNPHSKVCCHAKANI